MTENRSGQKRMLGQTDIAVTPVGLGTNKFSGGKGISGLFMPDLSQAQINDIVQAALDGGINWFDTAEMYGFGRSERAIARALQAAGKRDGEVVIATKWSPLMRTAGNIPRSIDKRAGFLDGYSIDLYMVHNPYGLSSPEREMDAMADLVAAGKIRSVGVSNFSAEQMRRAQATLAGRGLPLAVNQVEYSLLNRKIETNGVLEAARELGVTIIAWGPLGSGVLTGRYHARPEALREAPAGRRWMLRGKIEKSRPLVEALVEVGGQHGVTPAQVAVNWLLASQGESVVAIPGASKVHHARQSAAAMDFALSATEMARLDELSRDFR